MAHVLVERGLFGYDTPIAELWPEFGAHGKHGVTVRHTLTHTAGVPGLPLDLTPEDCATGTRCVRRSRTRNCGGNRVPRSVITPYTFGFIVGEIVRRVTGKPISQVLQEDVAAPLGVAGELYLGVPEPEQPGWLGWRTRRPARR